MIETMMNEQVTYTVNHAGKLFVIENVPARVCQETGEQFFSPETVEHIQDLIAEQRKPVRIMETPVYNYA